MQYGTAQCMHMLSISNVFHKLCHPNFCSLYHQSTTIVALLGNLSKNEPPYETCKRCQTNISSKSNYMHHNTHNNINHVAEHTVQMASVSAGFLEHALPILSECDHNTWMWCTTNTLSTMWYHTTPSKGDNMILTHWLLTIQTGHIVPRTQQAITEL